MKKIDIHIHIRLSTNQKDSASAFDTAGKLQKYLLNTGIASGIIMCTGESGFPDNDDCMNICRKYPFFHWNCNFDDNNPKTVFQRMARYKKMGAVGVGELTINKPMDSPMLTAVFEAAEKLGLPVLLHMSPRSGYGYGAADAPKLPLLEKTLKQFPRLKLVGHSQVFWNEISDYKTMSEEERNCWGSGKVLPGGRLPELFRTYPNLYGDLSAGSGYHAIVRDEAFGLSFLREFSDQLLFGTDTIPTANHWRSPLGHWLEQKLQAGALDQDTAEKIFFRNAQRLYQIP